MAAQAPWFVPSALPNGNFAASFAGMGEEDDNKLELFTASDFDYIRVECCESCKTYIKTVDLRKNGRSEPLVDELASAPLDLWSREHGYAKLQNNLLGM
jgi:formate dehydrogenase maturation protein FdhE